jgi:hypothetical protein
VRAGALHTRQCSHGDDAWVAVAPGKVERSLQRGPVPTLAGKALLLAELGEQARVVMPVAGGCAPGTWTYVDGTGSGGLTHLSGGGDFQLASAASDFSATVDFTGRISC